MSDIPDGQMTTTDKATDIIEQETFAPATPSIAGSQTTIEQALMAVINKGQTDQLGPVLDAFERLQDRNARSLFNKDMAAFREACPPIVQRVSNDQFKGQTVTRNGVSRPRRYADLQDIVFVVDKVLPRFGFSYRWGDDVIEEGFIRVPCIVTHRDGHSESSSSLIPKDSNAGASPQQKYGSAVTYAKRFALLKALGLTAMDDDDDAASTSTPVETITETQALELRDLMDVASFTDDQREKTLAFYSARVTRELKAIEDLPASEYAHARQFLQQKGAGK